VWEWLYHTLVKLWRGADTAAADEEEDEDDADDEEDEDEEDEEFI
jgi:hypothetical protein